MLKGKETFALLKFDPRDDESTCQTLLGVQIFSLLRCGQAYPNSTSLRKPPYFDFGKRVNVETEDCLRLDPCFGSTFPEFSQQP